MATHEEITRMTRMLEVEDMAFRQQLQDAVSSLSFIFHCLPWTGLPAPFLAIFIDFPLFQGFTDTSLTVGEAAAVLRNYEKRTGETLKRRHVREGKLQSRLQPCDYDIKGQVPPSLPCFPN